MEQEPKSLDSVIPICFQLEAIFGADYEPRKSPGILSVRRKEYKHTFRVLLFLQNTANPITFQLAFSSTAQLSEQVAKPLHTRYGEEIAHGRIVVRLYAQFDQLIEDCVNFRARRETRAP